VTVFEKYKYSVLFSVTLKALLNMTILIVCKLRRYAIMCTKILVNIVPTFLLVAKRILWQCLEIVGEG